MSYNGYTNYETWNISLWIDNEEGTYRRWRSQARRIFEHAGSKRVARRELADALKADHEEQLNSLDLPASWVSDILGAALGSVNWDEIAGNMLEEYPEDERTPA